MTKEELINKIRNNRSFDLRDSEFYEPWDISDETIKDMADNFYYLLKDVLNYLAINEEPVSEELGEYINELSKQFPEVSFAKLSRIAVRLAKWQKEQDNKPKSHKNVGSKDCIECAKYWQERGKVEMKQQLVNNTPWKDAQGDDLPEYEREVVVFTQNFPDDAGMMMVAIGHRPTPDGWDGKNLSTGEVKHYTPKTYDKGGWNIPNVKYWLDAKLPKEIEL